MLKKIFVIPFGLWLVVTLAWFLGAGGVSFRTQYGADAKIDFNRKYDRQVRQVMPSLGYVEESGGDGALVRLKPGPAPFCWLCGALTRDGGILPFASHRDGPWLYRAPAPDPNFDLVAIETKTVVPPAYSRDRHGQEAGAPGFLERLAQSLADVATNGNTGVGALRRSAPPSARRPSSSRAGGPRSAGARRVLGLWASS